MRFITAYGIPVHSISDQLSPHATDLPCPRKSPRQLPSYQTRTEPASTNAAPSQPQAPALPAIPTNTSVPPDVPFTLPAPSSTPVPDPLAVAVAVEPAPTPIPEAIYPPNPAMPVPCAPAVMTAPVTPTVSPGMPVNTLGAADSGTVVVPMTTEGAAASAASGVAAEMRSVEPGTRRERVWPATVRRVEGRRGWSLIRRSGVLLGAGEAGSVGREGGELPGAGDGEGGWSGWDGGAGLLFTGAGLLPEGGVGNAAGGGEGALPGSGVGAGGGGGFGDWAGGGDGCSGSAGGGEGIAGAAAGRVRIEVR